MPDQIATSLNRAARWLVARQDADGGWHSTTYGQLKDGAAVTALALYAVAHLPPQMRQAHNAAIDRGFAFLNRGLDRRGTIASPDGTLDFPTYASALWLLAVDRLGRPAAAGMQRKVAEYLIEAQIAEGRGFAPDSPSYGGWDFVGREDAQGITTGTNISIGCYVLEALAGARKQGSGDRRQESGDRRQETGDDAIQRPMALGKAWVLRCQQPDGGFVFTCEPQSLNNKAAYRDEQLTKPRSYGTATCDGLRALAACGLTPTDEPMARAIAWLGKRPAIEIVPGFEGLRPEDGWDRGLRYYYWASLTKVLPHLPPGDRDARRAALVTHLTGLQNDDGSWHNESDRMRENDPLIATPLAMVALAECVAD